MSSEEIQYCLFDARYPSDPDRALVIVMGSGPKGLKELRGYRDDGEWGDGCVVVKMKRNKDGALSDDEVVYD